jgi:hypothetical protein
MPQDQTLPKDRIDEIKAIAKQIAPNDNKLDQLYQRYEEVYFMDDANAKTRIVNVDEGDVKKTVSPTGRNAVLGMKRLLDTAEIHVTIRQRGEKSPHSDQIEKGLKHILMQSGMYRRARIEKDLNLSAVLYGPTILAAESVDDLITAQKKKDTPQSKMYVKHLEKIRKYTPVLLRAINPRQSFSRWGEFGMIGHLRKYEIAGDVAQERWGLGGLNRLSKYIVWDWEDLENRVAWIEGAGDGHNILIAKPHLMPSMNIVARFAGGSSLFEDSDRQMQSFLYAHVKGEWDRRENLFWTYLFTALFMQGLPGPLLIVDPESVGSNNRLDIDFTGGVRKIFAKAQTADFPVIDGDVLRIKELMDATNSESTIYKQTLGQNLSGSTFSGLAMLSSAGQLPLEDPKEAISLTFRDIFEHILCRIKEGQLDNDLIPPDQIPDEYEIDVSLAPKLPQDNLRNAQVAQGLGDLVSDEWKHENLLQIGDSKAMAKQVMREQLLKTMVAAVAQDPKVMGQMVQRILGQGQPANVGGNGQTPPTGQPTPEDMAMMEQGQPTPEQMAMMQQGGGMEAMPQTAPMIPPQERM